MGELIMTDTNNLANVKMVILNAAITGGIVFFSMVTTTDLPTTQNLWAAFVGMMLAMLIQLKALIPKGGIMLPPKIGMLV